MRAVRSRSVVARGDSEPIGANDAVRAWISSTGRTPDATAQRHGVPWDAASPPWRSRSLARSRLASGWAISRASE